MVRATLNTRVRPRPDSRSRFIASSTSFAASGARRIASLSTSALLAGPVGSVAVTHGQPGAVDPFRDHRTWLTLRRMGQFGGGGGLNFHREVDPIQDGPADTVAVILAAAGRTAAFPFGVAKISASAGVHRRHQLEARRIGYVRGRSRHGGSARFHWLAQRFQGLAGKFRQLIEKQYASMSEGNLPGLRAVAASGQVPPGTRSGAVRETGDA